MNTIFIYSDDYEKSVSEENDYISVTTVTGKYLFVMFVVHIVINRCIPQVVVF